MILLTRGNAPTELTDDFKDNLTKEFKANGTNVWNHDFLKKALRDYSFEKCCYCEVNIDEESKYCEVEHFLPKKHFPDLVLEWTNLLPSCKRCNGKKSEHRTDHEPIIDPTKVNPKDYLGLKNYRIRAKDELGKSTIETLDLNNYRKLIIKRAQIGDQVQSNLEEILLTIEETAGILSTRRRNSILRQLKKNMEEGQIYSDYCSTVATIIYNSLEYQEIKLKLSAFGLWDIELENLEKGLIQVKFDEVR